MTTSHRLAPAFAVLGALDFDIEVIYVTPAIVEELCGLTTAPTVITPTGEVLES